jgi:uncharacterized damage-inducible protein DinB
MVDEIRDLYEYNAWANHRILAAVAGLPPEQASRDLGSSFPSIRATLAHVLSAEWIWLTRWRGTSPTRIPDSWELSTLQALEAQWTAVEAELKVFVDGLTEEACFRTLEYQDTKGTRFAAPLWQLLRHVVNHSTYHRGQVVTMLRQLGAEGVATDLVRFHRERANAPEG